MPYVGLPSCYPSLQFHSARHDKIAVVFSIFSVAKCTVKMGFKLNKLYTSFLTC